MNYQDFIESKTIIDLPTGIKNVDDLEINSRLFDFQRDIVKWALRRGRACLWADCGLGKTAMQLEWAKHVAEYTGRPVMIITPLAVSEQTCHIEAPKFGIACRIVTDQSEIQNGINITNYEKLHHFNLANFGGVVLDESSILKNYTGTIRNTIIEATAGVPFRLACTATPAPNDFMELGNHAEFVGAMKYNEMLATFFVHDGGETSKWRLKKHAAKDFFAWVASWAVLVRNPGDLGYSTDNFKLPPIQFHEVSVKAEKDSNFLFPMEAQSLQERQAARRDSIDKRVEAASKIIDDNQADANDQFCVWCNLNQEADAMFMDRAIMVNIQGSDTNEYKAKSMLDFAAGKIIELVSKPKVAGFGMNWQNCHNVIFLGLSDSYEQFYQAIRRFYRFGQKKLVNVWIVISEAEGAVLANIKKKEHMSMQMYDEMSKYMNPENRTTLKKTTLKKTQYNPQQKIEMPDFF